MNLKKNLKSKRAQAIVEYIVTFVAIAVGIMVFFVIFIPATPDSPDNFFNNLRIKSVFNQAVDNAIREIQK